MYVLLIVLLFSGPHGTIQFKVPPAVPVFFSKEACEQMSEAISDAAKKEFKAKNVVYGCTPAIPVNTGDPA